MIEWFTHKSINRLRRMVQAIRSRDFAVWFPEEKLSGPERKLVEEINDVITDFRKQQLEQERRYGQYEALFNTINSSLIVTEEKGNIRFMNCKAIESLCGFRINHLSALKAVDPDLPDALFSLAPGQSKLQVISRGGKESQVKISLVRYSVEGEDTYLYSIEDVNMLLLQNEIDAQRKLVSVLTHEIMNSLSPIISLSDTLCTLPACSDGDTHLALQVIKRRSQGLLTFVENYRKLSGVSTPKLQWTSIGDIFDDLRKLYSAPFIEYVVADPALQLKIDRHQIVQVLINLIKNAIEACNDNPSIIVSATADHAGRRFIISVNDNGCGISKDSINKIFVPFFTTKPGGSGIGLSLSRQIINMHGGVLQYEPTESGSKFDVILPFIYRK